MKALQNLIKRFFPPAAPLKAGSYHFQSAVGAASPLRLHLRIEPDGAGLLIINAQTVLHLNQTAAEYAYHILQQTSPEQVAQVIADRYPVSQAQALQDFNSVQEKINSLLNTPDLDPITFLDIDRAELYSGSLSAPYRLDCAITYRQMEDTPSDVAPVARVTQELNTSDWLSILQKAQGAGIPHVIFTGGEPTLRDDLFALIRASEVNGTVTGLLTNGLSLAQPAYLHEILQSGLDHVTILLNPSNPIAWKAVRDTSAADIALTVHLTLASNDLVELSTTLTELNQAGIKHLSLSAIHQNFKPALLEAEKQAANLGMSLVWDIPVPYSAFNPVSANLEDANSIPQGAGKAWLYVEPDGDVLPTQGGSPVLGNLSRDSWDEVWANHPV